MTTDNRFAPWLSWIDSQHEQMLARTIELSEVNSGTLNAEGVNRVRKLLQTYSEALGGTMEVVPVEPFRKMNEQGELISYPLGDALRISKRPEAPLQVFFCGHMDTVFAIDHSFQSVRWLDEETINGPGVADLKGGLLVMLKAIECLERSPYAESIGWEILFNPDEEIGSPSSAALIDEAAKRADIGMIYEPCMPDGNFAGERKGSGNFSVVARGVAAHAGREHHLGRNALRALSEFIVAVDDLNGQREGVTFNPGVSLCQGAVNVVPDLATAHFNIRIQSPDDQGWCLEKLDNIVAGINQKDGISLALHGGFTRPPKVMTESNRALYELARECGHELGMELTWQATGGCCDGNNLAAAGVPNIDTLGVQGGAIHSSDEYMKVASLVERARLSALMLMKMAVNPPV
ncbi:hydrolase [Parendozoicomonas haliclonae]|uniref:Carboxypeptidase G2 n=1 Tax=Parendozoicomonas haliclonae TaxID=1960125 RepID=A0A1X7AL28_9GAMM|nr:hydrolase [Parendozoicomonas haliclonae]SMA47649.1 Carboxypeptidase G2 precursor [Parendozoicomonas haliclonae]